MNDFIKKKLNTIMQSDKNVAKKIDDFKKKYLTEKWLPLGILADTATAPGYLSSILSTYLKNNLPKKNNIAWNNYVRDNFDGILEIVKSANPQPNPQPTTKNPNQNVIIHRSFLISLSKVIREYLPTDIKNIIMDNINNTLTNSSDYIAKFSEIVFMSMILFKNDNFINIDYKPYMDLSEKGLDISAILPKSFDCGVQRFASSPLTPSMFFPEFATEINALFGETHLSLIHSHFFGTQGLSQSSVYG